MAEIKLVAMSRPGGNPDKAEVHPDEVANYQKGGWVVNDTSQLPKPANNASKPKTTAAKAGAKTDTTEAGAIDGPGDTTQAPDSESDESGESEV